MKRKRDSRELNPPWHVDCRIEAELPEDNIVGTRFLVNALFTAVAAGMLLFTGWLGYYGLSLRNETQDWNKRSDGNRAEVREIQRMQGEYAAEAAKIDQAYAMIRPRFYVSGFIANIGRTRPDAMVIDIVEWSEGGIVIRGSVRESSERATRMLGGYVEQLRGDDQIMPLFRDIRLTDLDRGGTGGALRFEINFLLKPAGT
ncbi:MAG: hypothetical protein Q7S40_14660 [Opitutaceae bacterium]|nr:hypothetical protein [Opitutaceae bacterium]